MVYGVGAGVETGRRVATGAATGAAGPAAQPQEKIAANMNIVIKILLMGIIIPQNRRKIKEKM